MDPRTSYPIEEMLSATIVAERGIEAEALSKAVMVNGGKWTKEFLKKRADVRAIIFYRQADGATASARLNF
jgi:thiamine biosynthesis lipoprotein ApbE